LEGLSVDGRIILSGFQEIDWEAIDWNFLAQDKDKWNVFVDMLTAHSGCIKCGGFLD
jgi:hypothetical protein